MYLTETEGLCSQPPQDLLLFAHVYYPWNDITARLSLSWAANVSMKLQRQMGVGSSWSEGHQACAENRTWDGKEFISKSESWFSPENLSLVKPHRDPQHESEHHAFRKRLFLTRLWDALLPLSHTLEQTEQKQSAEREGERLPCLKSDRSQSRAVSTYVVLNNAAVQMVNPVNSSLPLAPRPPPVEEPKAGHRGRSRQRESKHNNQQRSAHVHNMLTHHDNSHRNMEETQTQDFLQGFMVSFFTCFMMYSNSLGGISNSGLLTLFSVRYLDTSWGQSSRPCRETVFCQIFMRLKKEKADSSLLLVV